MRTLFINTGGIGDQILLLPAVKLLTEFFPDCEIDLLTEPRSAAIGELTNLYRKIRVFDFKAKNIDLLRLRKLIRAQEYKYLFCTGNSYKANLTACLSNADIKIGFRRGILSNLFLTHAAKINTRQYTGNMFVDLLSPIIGKNKFSQTLIPEIKLHPAAIEWTKETLNPRIKERYYARKIFIHPGVSKLSIQKNILKGWSPKNWANLIEKLLQNQNNTVILLGGKDDAETITEINKKLTFLVRPKNFLDFSSFEVTLDRLSALISCSDLLICVDSAPMHIAVGLGKKLVAFFGPTDPKKLLPNDPRFVAVYDNNLECRPCLFDSRKDSCSKPKCLEIIPDAMLNVINKHLEFTSVV